MEAQLKITLNALVKEASMIHTEDAVNAKFGDSANSVISASVSAGTRGGLAPHYATAHTSNAGVSDSILYGPIAHWADVDMHEDVRAFYRNFVNIIKKDASGNWEADGIKEDEYASINHTNSSNYRVNLKKIGGDKILFGETLPLSQVGTTAYFTGGSEKIEKATYLQDLYSAVLHNGVLSKYAGATDITMVVTPNLVKNLLRAQTATDSAHVVSGRSVSIDDYTFEDISTGDIWHRDSDKGLYKMANGARVYANDLIQGINKNDGCYGTGLDGARCEDVMKCLVDGESAALGACLEAHKSSDMWKLADLELQKLHPNMAVFVLKKFGIKGVHATTSSGFKVVVPMEFKRWLNKLDPVQKKNIEGNEQLCNYLKALIAFLRREPKILNKGLSDDRHGGVPEARPEYIKNLGLCQFNEPVAREQSMAFSAQLIRNMQPYTAPLLGVHFGDRYSEATNARMGHGSMGGGSGPMAGGCFQLGGLRPNDVSRTLGKRSGDGRVKCAEAHSLMLTNIEQELQSVGHTLSGDDKTRIGEAIKNMAELEGKLGKLHDILSTFIEVGQAFGIDYSKHADKPLKDVDINNIKDSDSLIRYLSTNVDEMKSCINSNSQLTANINNELVQKIYAQMLETGAGQNDGLVDLN